MSRSTRGRVRLWFEQLGFILGPQRFIVVGSPLVKSPQRPRGVAGECVGGQERQAIVESV